MNIIRSAGTHEASLGLRAFEPRLTTALHKIPTVFGVKFTRCPPGVHKRFKGAFYTVVSERKGSPPLSACLLTSLISRAVQETAHPLLSARRIPLPPGASLFGTPFPKRSGSPRRCRADSLRNPISIAHKESLLFPASEKQEAFLTSKRFGASLRVPMAAATRKPPVGPAAFRNPKAAAHPRADLAFRSFYFFMRW